MSWLSDLAGRAETLLNNFDEQTGAVLRSHAGSKEKKRELLPHPEKPSFRKKKFTPTTVKKNGAISETKSNGQTSAKSAAKSNHAKVNAQVKETQICLGLGDQRKKSQTKNTSYHLNNSPRTLVQDCKNIFVESYGLKKRRNSLPADLQMLNAHQFAYNMQTLEVENVMLKNELNVVNAEVTDLLDRLRKTEEELSFTKNRLNNIEDTKVELLNEKQTLTTKIQELRSKSCLEDSLQLSKYIEQNIKLQSEVNVLGHKNKELEIRIEQLKSEIFNKASNLNSTEKDLRQAQNLISELQDTIEKKNTERQLLENDWKTYKLRVKNMLHTKDNEIKILRDGTNLTEDTKVLMEQVESLKEEREDLSSAVARVREDCDALRFQMTQIEARRCASERVAAALRDTLKEERASRNKAETQCLSLAKELQTFQMQTSQTIANLRSALQVKDDEINHLRNTPSSIPTTDISLNVAEYDVFREIGNEKIDCLTKKIIHKQGKIDALLGENNILRIQLEKLESKYRSEKAAMRGKYSHSVVHLQDGESRLRARNTVSSLSSVSVKMGRMIRRFPIFRTFFICYMIVLHFWVLTVLLASTPEDYVPKPTKL